MGHYGKPNGSDLTIVTVVLQYGVFATHEYDGLRALVYGRNELNGVMEESSDCSKPIRMHLH